VGRERDTKQQRKEKGEYIETIFWLMGLQREDLVKLMTPGLEASSRKPPGCEGGSKEEEKRLTRVLFATHPELKNSTGG